MHFWTWTQRALFVVLVILFILMIRCTHAADVSTHCHTVKACEKPHGEVNFR